MKIYLASSFSLKDSVEEVKRHLINGGHTITVEWWHTDFKESLGILSDKNWYATDDIKHICQRNFNGIDIADAVILIAPKEGTKKFNGANIEIGYAIAKGKRVLSIGNIERSGMYQPIEKHIYIETLLASLENKLEIKNG